MADQRWTDGEETRGKAWIPVRKLNRDLRESPRYLDSDCNNRKEDNRQIRMCFWDPKYAACI